MRNLLFNLYTGFRLASFLKVDAAHFRVSLAQLTLLVLIDFALMVGIGYAQMDGDAVFNRAIIVQALASLMITLAMAALLARALRAPALLPGYAVAAMAMSPTMMLYLLGGYALWQRWAGDVPDWVWSLGVLLWMAALLTRAVGLWAPMRWARRAGVEVLLIVTLALEFWALPRHDPWYANYANAGETVLQPGAHEALLYQQTALLDRQVDALAPQRPGVSDLYFVGVAGYGWQDVFMKEVNTVRALFDRRFDTRSRSLALINNAQSADTVPLATATALARTLKRVGGLMDADEDVLFLFLTSHGSEDPAYLSIDQDGLRLTQLTPARLKAALAATPIKWKVVVVSACYSGSFIPALKDDTTLLITASSADRNSFGCSDTNELTDFGRAYFAEALAETASFTGAFDLAKKRIAEREAAEDLTPSQPQMVMGKQFAARWQGRYVGTVRKVAPLSPAPARPAT